MKPSPVGVYGVAPLSLLVATLLISGCQSESSETPAAAAAEPVTVDVQTIRPHTMAVPRVYPGRTQASDDVQVRSRISGIVLERQYQEGRLVSEGSPLFQIDPTLYQSAVQQAQADLDYDKAQLRQAEREWKRISSLYKSKTVSERDYDNALSNLELAKASVQRTAASLDDARIHLDYTAITTPISGYAGIRQVEPGDLINEGDVLVTVQRLDPIYVQFSIPEADAVRFGAALQPDAGSGQASDLKGDVNPVHIRLLQSDGRVYEREGRIDFSDRQVDPETGTVRLRAQFPNPNAELIPGQFVRLRVNGLQLENAIDVPARSVSQRGQESALLLVNSSNEVEPVEVQLGERIGERQLVVGGLSAGDRVIVSGQMKLQPGMTVDPQLLNQNHAQTETQSKREQDVAEVTE